MSTFSLSANTLTALRSAMNEDELLEKRVTNYEGIQYALKMMAGKTVIDTLPPMYLGVKKAAYVAIRKTYEVFCGDRKLLESCLIPQDVYDVMENLCFFNFDLFRQSKDEEGKTVVMTVMAKFARAMVGETI